MQVMLCGSGQPSPQHSPQRMHLVQKTGGVGQVNAERLSKCCVAVNVSIHTAYYSKNNLY